MAREDVVRKRKRVEDGIGPEEKGTGGVSAIIGSGVKLNLIGESSLDYGSVRTRFITNHGPRLTFAPLF